jgi:uncharacterized repeat protein (TIGR03987 family)
MSIFLIAVIFITIAAIFYTLAVLAEKFQGGLMWWHVDVFWLGLACDTVGTTAMGKIVGTIQLNFHGITGLIAIILMIFHTLWATHVLLSANEHLKIHFHKLSILVWLIWLIPMTTGILMGALK